MIQPLNREPTVNFKNTSRGSKPVGAPYGCGRMNNSEGYGCGIPNGFAVAPVTKGDGAGCGYGVRASQHLLACVDFDNFDSVVVNAVCRMRP